MSKTFILILLAIQTLTCQNQSVPNRSDCSFLYFLEPSEQVICGTLEVPENHNQTGNKKIAISYVVLKATNGFSDYPLIYLSGGPGGSTLSEGRINFWKQNPIRNERDIILLDQRGIGHSSALPNIHQELYSIFAKDAEIEEEQTLMNELISNYKGKCRAVDIELEHYNSFQNAHDIGLLMEELNYNKYNLYGTSYGTRLARIVQEFYPQKLNSVILNSPNPLVGDFLIDRLKSYSLSLERVFNYCKNNQQCHEQYPNLQAQYLEALESLKKNPLELDIDGNSFTLNAQEGVYFLRRQLYGVNSRSNIPLLVKEYLNGGGPLIKRLIRNEFAADFNFSMWLAVERYEMYNPKNTQEVINKTYETLPLLSAQLGLFTTAYLALDKLHSSSLSKEEKEFGVSSVPTLITVNHFDPVTPPENGHIMMEKLKNGHLFILNEGGHGGGNAECRTKVMTEFMNNPLEVFDSSCLNIYRD